MFCKASVFVTLLAASAHLVAANTPSCLLAAVNTQKNPADLQAVCKNSSEVEKTISSTCGNNAQAAIASFKSVCQGAGVQIAAYSSASGSSTGTSTGTGTMTASATGGKVSATSTIVYTSHYYDSSCSCTKSTMVTGTAYVGPSGIATGTSGVNGTSPAQATGAVSAGSGSTSGSGGSSTAGAAAAGSKGSATSSASSVPASTGAAGKVEVAGLSMGAFLMAGLVLIV